LNQILLNSSLGPNDDGYILNALDFPLPTSNFSPDTLSIDLQAWTATERLPFCNKETASFPAQHLQWGLFATYGALHYGHIDLDGFCTTVDILVGGKYWIVAHPQKREDYGKTELYCDKMWCMERPDPDIWCFEAILLEPGMRL